MTGSNLYCNLTGFPVDGITQSPGIVLWGYAYVWFSKLRTATTSTNYLRLLSQYSRTCLNGATSVAEQFVRLL